MHIRPTGKGRSDGTEIAAEVGVGIRPRFSGTCSGHCVRVAKIGPDVCFRGYSFLDLTDVIFIEISAVVWVAQLARKRERMMIVSCLICI